MAGAQSAVTRWQWCCYIPPLFLAALFEERVFMKRFLLASAAIVAFATGASFVPVAAADSTATPGGPAGACPPGPPLGPWGAGWRHGPSPFPGPDRGPGAGPDSMAGPAEWEHHRHDIFSLFAPAQNKNLTPADVKVIAAAMLLEGGNHSWSVTNVAAQSDKSIDFSFATAHGDVVATFSIDPVSGRIDRKS